jgi:hypothetical protein
MSERRIRRRRIVTASGYHVSLCGRAFVPPRGDTYTDDAAARPETFRFAWISGAGLLLVVLFSVYAVERPPAFPDDPRNHAPISAYERYSLSDILTAVSR